MEPVLKQRYFTVEEYEAYEASISGRAEYRDGIIVDMAGGSKMHGQIALNLGSELRIGLKGKPCIVYPSDVKVQAERAKSYFYPDLSVACEESEASRMETPISRNPVLIVEVLSESTAIDDVGAKFFAYQQIESLKDYIVVDQYSPLVNVMHRNEDGEWKITSTSGLNDSIEIKSLGLRILMSEIYDKVAFPENKRPLIQS
jgi:Uma2 family endonuclease